MVLTAPVLTVAIPVAKAVVKNLLSFDISVN